MEKYYEHINNTMNIDIDEFEFLMNKIDLFTLNNTDYLFSTEMPRNFLINFAINIDKYERIKTQKLDGINDYINFYTNDTSILEVPKKEDPTPDTDPNPSQDPKEEPSDGPSAGLIVFLVIIGILLVGGLGYGGFLIWKKKQNPDIEKRFNKYAKFEDEDINENKVVY